MAEVEKLKARNAQTQAADQSWSAVSPTEASQPEPPQTPRSKAHNTGARYTPGGTKSLRVPHRRIQHHLHHCYPHILHRFRMDMNHCKSTDVEREEFVMRGHGNQQHQQAACQLGRGSRGRKGSREPWRSPRSGKRMNKHGGHHHNMVLGCHGRVMGAQTWA